MKVMSDLAHIKQGAFTRTLGTRKNYPAFGASTG
jgi:hypothetical protein